MKSRRLLVLFGVLLMFVGSTLAVGGQATMRSVDVAGHPDGPGDATERDAPRLDAFSGVHRVAAGAPGQGRRVDGHHSTIGPLAPVDAGTVQHGCESRVDPEASARLLRATNTPCGVRGPPVAG